MDFTQLSLTGVTMMVAGWLFSKLRQAPTKGIGLVRRRFITEVEVMGNDPLFSWLQMWLAEHPYSRRVRGLTATTTTERGGDIPASSVDHKTKPRIRLTPAPGHYFFWDGARPVWISRTRERQTNNNNAGYGMYIETYTIRTLGTGREHVISILEAARDLALSSDVGLQVYVAGYDYWRELGYYPRRPRESVILDGDTFERLEADCRQFRESGAWYAEMGIPYRRGWLFEGVPGSGKTSTILALASLLDAPLYILNLADWGLSDGRLIQLLNSVPTGAIVLIEDVDVAFAGRKRDEASEGISFSGLLNAIDGAASGFGRMLFMTTNHLEVLDAALIRPGRCDSVVHFGPATQDQLRRQFERFFPEDPRGPVFAQRAHGMSMAEAQEFLLARGSALQCLARLARSELSGQKAGGCGRLK